MKHNKVYKTQYGKFSSTENIYKFYRTIYVSEVSDQWNICVADSGAAHGIDC
jgi:hypothetical protein